MQPAVSALHVGDRVRVRHELLAILLACGHARKVDQRHSEVYPPGDLGRQIIAKEFSPDLSTGSGQPIHQLTVPAPMADSGLVCYMSRSGNVWDDAAMESFFLVAEDREHSA
jgi:transposase InsO family protein